MKKYFYIFLCSLMPILCFGQTETNVDGWRNAKWGMTENEVLAAFPNEAKSKDQPGIYGNGTHSMVTIENLKISENAFKADFLFNDKTKRLTQINLRALSSDTEKTIFPAIEQMLTEKYGKPDFTNDRNPYPGAKDMARSWTREKTKIELDLFHDSAGNHLLEIIYRQLTAEGKNI